MGKRRGGAGQPHSLLITAVCRRHRAGATPWMACSAPRGPSCTPHGPAWPPGRRASYSCFRGVSSAHELTQSHVKGRIGELRGQAWGAVPTSGVRRVHLHKPVPLCSPSCPPPPALGRSRSQALQADDQRGLLLRWLKCWKRPSACAVSAVAVPPTVQM